MARAYLTSVLVALLAMGSSPGPPAVSAGAPGPALVLREADFGKTILVRIGQTVVIDVPGWDLRDRSATVLEPVSSSQATPGFKFTAVRSGSQLITAAFQPVFTCKTECNAPATRYGTFVVIGIPTDQSFDLAMSQLDKGKLFLLTPGTRVVAAIPFADRVSTNPAVMVATPFAGAPSLSVLIAATPGIATISGTGFGLDVLVKPAAAPYDIVVPDQDAGRTIRLKTGQTIRFRLMDSPGFKAWTGGGANLLRLVVDLTFAKDGDATSFGYLVRSTGSESVRFNDSPRCVDDANCRELSRTIEFQMEIPS